MLQCFVTVMQVSSPGHQRNGRNFKPDIAALNRKHIANVEAHVHNFPPHLLSKLLGVLESILMKSPTFGD